MCDEKAFCLFIKLLLSVDWKTGTMNTGRLRLSELSGYSRSTVYKVLLRLEREGMVKLTSSSSKTHIRILNWKKWQAEIVQENRDPVTTRGQLGDNLKDNFENNPPINKIDNLNNLEDNPRISEVRSRDTIQKEEEYNINNPSKDSSGSVKEEKDSELKAELEVLMKIVNPKEKLTPGRVTLLRARKKEKYTFDEIKAAAYELSRSKWHKENRQMTIDNLLRPSKFGNWYQKSQESKKSYVIPGSRPTSTPLPVEERKRTPEQIERGKIIRELLNKGVKLIAVQGKSNAELRELLSVK